MNASTELLANSGNLQPLMEQLGALHTTANTQQQTRHKKTHHSKLPQQTNHINTDTCFPHVVEGRKIKSLVA